MALVLPYRVPRMIVIGADQTLPFPVVDSSDTDTELTPSAGTFTLLDGDEVVVDETAISDTGPPADYDLVAADTSGRALSDTLLEKWALTFSGVESTLIRTAYLVRWAFRSTVTDGDLLGHDPSLSETVPTGTTFQAQRELASERIERDLIKRGRRPELILDSWALHDAEIALTLHFIYRGQDMALSDGRYRRESLERLAEYRDEMDALKYRYDQDKSGTVTDASRESGATLVLATGAGRLSGNGARVGRSPYASLRMRRRR